MKVLYIVEGTPKILYAKVWGETVFRELYGREFLRKTGSWSDIIISLMKTKECLGETLSYTAWERVELQGILTWWF